MSNRFDQAGSRKGFTLFSALGLSALCVTCGSSQDITATPDTEVSEITGSSTSTPPLSLQTVPAAATSLPATETSQTTETKVATEPPTQTSGTLPPPTTSSDTTNLLVYTETSGHRHAQAIEAGKKLIRSWQASNNFAVTEANDSQHFTETGLADFDVVIFLETSEDILDDNEQHAFEKYIQSGRGFVGVHSATDTEYDWAWYGELVGAYFQSHPLVPNDEFVDCHCFERNLLVNNSHRSTSHLDSVWRRRDEWYSFRNDGPSSQVSVLLRVEEAAYPGGEVVPEHPVAWYHEFDGGRSWYTALGHTPESFDEPEFQSIYSAAFSGPQNLSRS